MLNQNKLKPKSKLPSQSTTLPNIQNPDAKSRDSKQNRKIELENLNHNRLPNTNLSQIAYNSALN